MNRAACVSSQSSGVLETDDSVYTCMSICLFALLNPLGIFDLSYADGDHKSVKNVGKYYSFGCLLVHLRIYST